MGSYKTAAPCEVCGLRCAHSGHEKGFPVGRKVSGVTRLVHERCRLDWHQRKKTIMDKWPELRPEVLSTLPSRQRDDIEQFHRSNLGDSMARQRKQQPFGFSAEHIEWIRPYIEVELKEYGKLHRGFVTTLYELMRKEHPHKMPSQADAKYYYNEFLKFVQNTTTHIVRMSKPVPPPASSPLVTEVVSPSVVAPVTNAELDAIAKAAHALIDLAHARNDQAVLELALVALDNVLHPPKPAS